MMNAQEGPGVGICEAEAAGRAACFQKLRKAIPTNVTSKALSGEKQADND